MHTQLDRQGVLNLLGLYVASHMVQIKLEQGLISNFPSMYVNEFLFCYIIKKIQIEILKGLTKHAVGAKANPPKNPRRPPKKGIVIATDIVEDIGKVRRSFTASPRLHITYRQAVRNSSRWRI